MLGESAEECVFRVVSNNIESNFLLCTHISNARKPGGWLLSIEHPMFGRTILLVALFCGACVAEECEHYYDRLVCDELVECQYCRLEALCRSANDSCIETCLQINEKYVNPYTVLSKCLQLDGGGICEWCDGDDQCVLLGQCPYETYTTSAASRPSPRFRIV